MANAEKAESGAAILAAILANLAIGVIKFVAAWITGSSAMIAEGIHSFVDMGNGGLVLLGVKRSGKAADESHPFGHGKELYFWTLVVAISIFGIGGGMSVYEGVTHLLAPSPIEDATASYIVLAISAIAEGSSFVVAMRQLDRARGRTPVMRFIRQAKDPSLFTIVFEDSAAVLGLLIAFLGVFLGHRLQNPYFDGGASILIGLLLMSVAWLLARESKGLLIGEGVEPEALRRMRSLVGDDPDVAEVGEMRTMYLGPHDLLVNLDVRFTDGIDVASMHAAIERIEARLRDADPDVNRIYIESAALLQIAEKPGAPEADADSY